MIKLLLTISLSLLLFTSVLLSQISAQDQPVAAVPLEQLNRDYFFQIEKYLEANEKFRFERAEFNKIGTLAAQEDALSAMKQLMVARAGTLKAYLATVERQLWDTTSIDPGLKQTALDQLQLAQLTLKTHQEEVPGLFEKENILATSKEFETDIGYVFEAQYRSLALISLDRIIASLDALTQAANDFENQAIAAIPDPSLQAAHIRGLKEVSQKIHDSRQAVATAQETYLQMDLRRKGTEYQGDYASIVKQLQPAYASMRQAVDFLIELERGL